MNQGVRGWFIELSSLPAGFPAFWGRQALLAIQPLEFLLNGERPQNILPKPLERQREFSSTQERHRPKHGQALQYPLSRILLPVPDCLDIDKKNGH